jgi:peptidoglycan/LPS O-acetylase OafA/YrhL
MNLANNHAHRLRHLDGLRGIAAVWVMMYHYSQNYDHNFGHPKDLGWSISFGSYAFLLFFMISGFVILMSVDRMHSAWDFAVARFARLYPVYWVALAITFSTVTLSGMLPERQVTLEEAVINLTMLQGFLGVPNVDGVYWTLHIELCFYIVMALMLASGMRSKLPWIVLGMLALTTVRWLTPYFDTVPGLWRLKTLFPLSDHFPWFAVGIAAYELKRQICWQYILLTLLSTLMIVLSRPMSELGITSVVLACFFLAVTGLMPWLASRPLFFVGTISYSLYLIHGSIGYVIIRSCYGYGINGNVAIVLATSVSMLSACSLTFLVERPAHSWLRKLRAAVSSPPR